MCYRHDSNPTSRLVAGGDQQDRTMYEDLAAPTAATANVFAMAAMAAREKRVVATVDIGVHT